jgi:hypothetical protein
MGHLGTRVLGESLAHMPQQPWSLLGCWIGLAQSVGQQQVHHVESSGRIGTPVS